VKWHDLTLSLTTLLNLVFITPKEHAECNAIINRILLPT
jgi:hypothetical protein